MLFSACKAWIWALLAVLAVITAVSAAEINGVLELQRELVSQDQVDTTIELIGVSNTLKTRAFLQKNGEFKFSHIPKGEYLLSAISNRYNLAPFKTKVVVSENSTVEAFLFTSGTKWNSPTVEVPLPIKIVPSLKAPERIYLLERSNKLLESGPIATVVNNPLYLFGGIIVLVSLVLPNLVGMIDPEAAKLMKQEKLKRQQKSSAAALKVASNMTGLVSDAAAISATGSKHSASKVAQTSKKSKSKKN